jgi:hypothetical protein
MRSHCLADVDFTCLQSVQLATVALVLLFLVRMRVRGPPYECWSVTACWRPESAQAAGTGCSAVPTASPCVLRDVAVRSRETGQFYALPLARNYWQYVYYVDVRTSTRFKYSSIFRLCSPLESLATFRSKISHLLSRRICRTRPCLANNKRRIWMSELSLWINYMAHSEGAWNVEVWLHLLSSSVRGISEWSASCHCLGVPRSQMGPRSEPSILEKNLLPVPGMEPRFLEHQSHHWT